MLRRCRTATPAIRVQSSSTEKRRPAPPKARHVVTEALRSKLLVSTWLTLALPPRDYLLGDVLCSTSRWLIFGETGIGKTLAAMDLGAAVSAGQPFLNWEGRRRARVMYLDGELPAETFKERMELIAQRYGPDISFWGYSRDVLGDDDMPPLNTPEGAAWLMREIEVVKPDLIIFDAIMCLLAGSMSEEESWAPVKLLMRQLSARRVAQIWLHHAGHDATKGFGTKTREWEMDTVIALLKADPEKDDGAMRPNSGRPVSGRPQRLRNSSHRSSDAVKAVGPLRTHRSPITKSRRVRLRSFEARISPRTTGSRAAPSHWPASTARACARSRWKSSVTNSEIADSCKSTRKGTSFTQAGNISGEQKPNYSARKFLSKPTASFGGEVGKNDPRLTSHVTPL